MRRNQKNSRQEKALISEQDLPRILRALVSQTPISTCITDETGTLAFTNEACRRLLGIERDEEIVGKYNILKDEEIIGHGLVPQISRVFEEGGSTEFVIDYDFAEVKRATAAHPPPKALRFFVFAIKDSAGHVQHAVIQHEDHSEKRRAEKALAESEARYRAVVGDQTELICRFLPDTTLTFVNEAYCRYFGKTREELIGHSLMPLIPEEDHERVRAHFAGLTPENPVAMHEHRVISKSGEVRWQQWTNRAVYDETGACVEIQSVGRDITDRRQAEEALREAEAKYRSLVEESLVGVYIIQDSRLAYINPRWAEIFGYTQDEIMPEKPILELVAPESRAEAAENIRKRLAGEVESIHYTFKGLRKDGRIIDVEVLGTRTMLHGEPAIIGTLIDVTERKRAEAEREKLLHDTGERIKELRCLHETAKSMRQRDTLEEIFQDVVTFIPPAWQYPEVTRARIRFDGNEYLSSEFRETEWEQSSDIVVGGERKGTVEAYYTEERPPSDEGPFLKEERQLIDGIARSLGEAIERKRAEEAIRRSEENFRGLFEYMPAAIFGYDRNATVVQVNAAFERVYGFTREEVVGRSMFETFVRPEDRAKTEEVIDRIFAGEIVENIEWEDVHADGTPLYVLTNTTPVRNPAGEMTMALSLNIDIGERKMAEQRRRELEEHKRDFYRRTILAATEGKLVISERDQIERVAGPSMASWKIARGEDMGMIRAEAAGLARSAGMAEPRVYDFVLALGEAITNAFKHAGGGTASLHRRNDSLLFMVSDRGPGIEALTLPEAVLGRGYSTAGSLGVGYKHILSVADEVYLATGPTGTTVAIKMKLQPQEKPLAVAGLPDTWVS